MEAREILERLAGRLGRTGAGSLGPVFPEIQSRGRDPVGPSGICAHALGHSVLLGNCHDPGELKSLGRSMIILR